MYPALKYAMTSDMVANVLALAKTSAYEPSSEGVQLSHCLPIALDLYEKSIP